MCDDKTSTKFNGQEKNKGRIAVFTFMVRKWSPWWSLPARANSYRSMSADVQECECVSVRDWSLREPGVAQCFSPQSRTCPSRREAREWKTWSGSGDCPSPNPQRTHALSALDREEEEKHTHIYIYITYYSNVNFCSPAWAIN